MTRPSVHQFTPAVAPGDAISNEIFAIRQMLRTLGYPSEVFAQHVDPALVSVVQSIWQYGGEPGNVLLVHHSLGHETFDKVVSLPDRKILVYHNITPIEFLRDNSVLAGYARTGKEQLIALRDRVEFAFADSEYNRLELEEIGYPATDVLPVTFALPELRSIRPSSRVKRAFRSSRNILFVGRIVPNKRQDDLIRAFSYYYRRIDARSRLVLVGGFEGFEAYQQALVRLADGLGVAGAVVFAGRVSAEDLVAYYQVASVFVSMSEHEGFGVPLLESMLFDVPVMAYRAGAVPYTMGGAGVLFARKEIPLLCEMIHCLIHDRGLRQRVLAVQRARLAELDPERAIRRLVAVVDGLPAAVAEPVGA